MTSALKWLLVLALVVDAGLTVLWVMEWRSR